MNHPQQNRYLSEEEYETNHSSQRQFPHPQRSPSGPSREPLIEHTPSFQQVERNTPNQPWYGGQTMSSMQDFQRQHPSPLHAVHASPPPAPSSSGNDNSHHSISYQNNVGLGYRYGPQSITGSSAVRSTAYHLPVHALDHQSTRNPLGNAQSQRSVSYIHGKSYADTSPPLYYDLSEDVAPGVQQQVSASYSMQPSAFSYPNSTPSYYGMNSRLNTSSSSLPHPSTTSPVQNSPIQHPQRSAPYPIPGNTAPKMMEMALDASRSSHQSRPHSCDECGLSFARGHDLKRHRETHKNIRPYLCDCGKSFTRKDALKRHRYLKGCGTGGSSPGSGGGYSTGED